MNANELYDEYSIMMKVLSHGNGHITDHLKKSGEAIVTYGDSTIKNNTEHPKETILTGAIDHCTKQCLDFILEFSLTQFEKSKCVTNVE